MAIDDSALFAQDAIAPVAGTANMPVMSWSELQSMPLPVPALRIAYGKNPLQFGELRLPQGSAFKGPFPVVILIHGGCWLADFDYTYMTRLAAVLAKAGIASWTIEYRRIGDTGGGWPGTFLDVARATDDLRQLAQRYPLNLKKIVALGHSSGGQLALWLAARAKLPHDSALYLPSPLKLRGVIGLAAVTDLASYRIGPAGSCNAAVDTLLGGSPETWPLRYAETSPLALLPLGVPQWLVQGDRDNIVPSKSADLYAEAARAVGDRVTLLPVAGAGHFELVAPVSASGAWQIWQNAVEQSLDLPVSP
jgi:acetyl esterase/lipase